MKKLLKIMTFSFSVVIVGSQLTQVVACTKTRFVLPNQVNTLSEAQIALVDYREKQASLAKTVSVWVKELE
ncbi:hypothetical protein SCLARK_00929 [Spiroplasma clarkii]|uniref:Uncharacterized protein n=1 Tax=Spiroplasma clarkii TaxID=2139 RepID=A0A1Y0L0K7_9MOLU|nr:hypothetical protein [Spiroplasma clarkii]ARU91537.1 hypothetical protein SCLARK_00929 [Spiroplasma clarkii]ATX70943.1 hypothetical protein SCLAR_v1c06240 [Spiroplasma clarkii]